jgi:hypothetical protein
MVIIGLVMISLWKHNEKVDDVEYIVLCEDKVEWLRKC